MSRELESGADASLQAEHVSQVVFLEFDFLSGVSRVCSREHSVSWNGETWLGRARVGSVEPIGEGGELEARGVAMSLSALPSGMLATALNPSEYKGRNVRMWFGQFGEEVVQSGTAQAGAASTLTLAAGTTGTDNEHNGKILRLLTGAGSVQERDVSGYVAGTKVATVAPRWRTNMLLHADALDNAAWSKEFGSVSADQAVDSQGNLTADHWIANAAATNAVVNQRRTTVLGQAYVGSVEFSKESTLNNFQIYWCWNGGPFGTDRSGLNVTVSSQAVTPFGIAAGPVPTYSIETLVGGWYRLNLFATDPSGGLTAFVLRNSDGSANGVKFLRFARSQQEQAADAGEHITTGAAAITVPDSSTTYDLVHPRGIVADPVGPFIFKMDQLTYQLGEMASIRLTAESRLVDWNRPRVRRYNNSDHQALHPGDRFFEHTEKQIEQVYRW